MDTRPFHGGSTATGWRGAAAREARAPGLALKTIDVAGLPGFASARPANDDPEPAAPRPGRAFLLLTAALGAIALLAGGLIAAVIPAGHAPALSAERPLHD